MQSGSPFLALLSGLAEIAAVLVGVFAVFLLIREWTDRHNVRLQQVQLGLLFAGSVIYCMIFPATLAPGVIVDPRGALLTLAGLFGGPVIAATSLLVTVAVRGWLGGAGMFAGIAGSVLASLLGVGLWWAGNRNRTGPPTWWPLLAAAAGAATISLLGFLLVPPREVGLALMREAGPAVALVQFASVLLLGGLLRAESRLHRYLTLAETAPAAICITDEATGHFLFANRRAHQLLDVPEGDLRGKTMPSFYVEPAQREALVREIQRTGGIEERTIDIVTAAGRNAVLAVTIRPGHWDGRRALIWAAVDVSGIRRMHRELDRQDALNSTILETLSDGLVVMETDGTIRIFNPMAERIFGWEADEILGRNVGLLLVDRRRDDARDGPRGSTPLDRLLTTGRRIAGGTRHEIGGRRRDGSTFPLEITVAEIATGENGGERYLLGIVRDVTERRRSIDALIEARTAAEVAHRTQRDFLAHMSHELRTPLNSILGFSELIQLGTVGPVPDKYRDYAASIHLAGDHLLRLINDVLDLSKVEQGYLSLHEDRVRPEDLVDAVARLFKPKAEERNLLLEMHPPTAPFDILGDFVRLRQILFNLVSNGIKFSPAGGRVSLAIERDEGGDVLITVADRGIGMTAEEVIVALKPFGQVRSEVTRSHEGTGLGLSISKSLVERHDGSLDIDSTPQQGTKVTVRLPASRALPRDAGTPC